MPRRRNTTIRFTVVDMDDAQKIADSDFDGNRSQAIRRLFALGLAAWAAGARTPQQVGVK